MSLRREDGQALVELALVIPLLLILLFGIVDFGMALNQYNDTTNLANLGARAAIVAPVSGTSSTPNCVTGTTTSTDLTQYLRCEGALDSSALGNVTVCASDTNSPSDWKTGDTILVKVVDTFNWIQILAGGVGHLGGSVPSPTTTISSSASMREEGNPGSEPSWVSTEASASC